MNEHISSYRNIAKTTTLFGGVQVVQIIASIVRGKFVAVLIGASGMGILTLLTNAVNLVIQISGFGIGFSAVRDISQAVQSQDEVHLSKTITSVRRWTLFCGLLGGILIAVFSPFISKFSFGTTNYRWWFVWLSIAVVLTTLSNSNIAILQGTRRLREMAKASLIGAGSGILASIPIYYFFGIDGIVPVMIVSSFAIFIINWWYARRVELKKVGISLKDSFHQGKEMAKLGVTMMIAGLLGSMTLFLINVFISYFGTVSDVGLYSAGTSITNQYLGVIFMAMAVEYFPRLSTVCNSAEKVNEMVNQQSEMVILIATPLIIAMMLTAPLLIRILLSEEFLVITQFITIIAFGMLFKAASFPLGYIALAKGDKQMYFWFEGVFNNALVLVLNIGGYYLYGLTGMAIAFAISYVAYYFVIIIITRIRYGFYVDEIFARMFLVMVFMTGAVFLQTQFFDTVWGYIFGIIIFCLSLIICYKELNKRIDIKQLLFQKFRQSR